jgi:hypothetical protein
VATFDAFSTYISEVFLLPEAGVLLTSTIDTPKQQQNNHHEDPSWASIQQGTY